MLSFSVEAKLAELDNEYENACKAIESTGKMLICSLTPQQAEMSIYEFRSKFHYTVCAIDSFGLFVCNF